MSGAPLSDLLVREIADDVSGAYAGKCLSDLGVRVVKVASGDPPRKVGPFGAEGQEFRRGRIADRGHQVGLDFRGMGNA